MCLEYWHWSIDRYCPIDANEITTTGSGVASSQDCNRVDHVLFNTLINRSLLSSWYSKRNRSQCSSVHSLRDCDRVDHVLLKALINRSLLSGWHRKRGRFSVAALIVHRIVWIVSYLTIWSIDLYCPVYIANEIAPSVMA